MALGVPILKHFRVCQKSCFTVPYCIHVYLQWCKLLNTQYRFSFIFNLKSEGTTRGVTRDDCMLRKIMLHTP